MDLTTVSTAAALLAILLAWYALLEYEDRRRGEDVREGPVNSPGGDDRAA